MAQPAQNGAKWRANPFNRNSASPSPVVSPHNGRPMSTMAPSTLSPAHALSHQRNQSFSPSNHAPALARNNSTRPRSNSHRSTTPATGTFAQTFITSDEIQNGTPAISRIEGENDFSGKRYVWLKDPNTAFIRGWVVDELGGGRLLVQCDDGSVCRAWMDLTESC
jgi:myosin protein heavy chain